MIGGQDIVIAHPARDRLAVLDLVLNTWPDAVMERSLSLPGDAALSEYLVYKDLDSLIAWTDNGATEEHADAMLHVLFGSKGTTCVVGGPETKEITARVRTELERQWGLKPVLEYSPLQQEGCFWECGTCRSKSGSPALCESCLHNRQVIVDLKRRIGEKV